MSLEIRQLTIKDVPGAWEVLKDGSNSNIGASFRLILTRQSTWIFAFTTLYMAYVYTGSVEVTVWTFISYFAAIYIFVICGSLYYIYGPPLADMRKPKETYMVQDNTSFLVAEMNRKIVGTIAIVPKPQTSTNTSKDNGHEIAWLRRMAVLRKYRGRGIAKKLLRAAILFSRKAKYKQIDLITTDVHFAARNLYTKMGFECISYKPIRRLIIFVWTYEFTLQL
ncbi:unnamed protein product [Owenia fusiformis]|uniref:N-acetyltransferase domain-containing protein n=1 Tax=Owenia fusiformis TaxID=6347 RepID=A0A8J1XUK3_OWEFU|nr:unnamed protein product [Owenia fusiformis]